MFAHEDPEWQSLVRIVAGERKIPVALVEKDYWIMHVLYSVRQSGLTFYMKGGTSLSKGFRIIERFSEDIDVLIETEELSSKKSRKGDKEGQIRKRREFFDSLPDRINVPGSSRIVRDHDFDDETLRNAGVRVLYPAIEEIADLKEGILLEVGFDDVEPYELLTISSWAVDYLHETNRLEEYDDNRAVNVPCYFPEYTFVEKLQTVSTKYRQLRDGRHISNFARHYYDLDRLLAEERVVDFFRNQRDKYTTHKAKRFRKDDEPNLRNNEAFTMPDPQLRRQVTSMYASTTALYYGDAPSIDDILGRIEPYLPEL